MKLCTVRVGLCDMFEERHKNIYRSSFRCDIHLGIVIMAVQSKVSVRARTIRSIVTLIILDDKVGLLVMSFIVLPTARRD
jgi:hypothetical protein